MSRWNFHVGQVVCCAALCLTFAFLSEFSAAARSWGGEMTGQENGAEFAFRFCGKAAWNEQYHAVVLMEPETLVLSPNNDRVAAQLEGLRAAGTATIVCAFGNVPPYTAGNGEKTFGVDQLELPPQRTAVSVGTKSPFEESQE